tara:strand:- start:525 stop:662 length:138 start_codon:yes stop_codon:yes gene_type:complete
MSELLVDGSEWLMGKLSTREGIQQLPFWHFLRLWARFAGIPGLVG